MMPVGKQLRQEAVQLLSQVTHQWLQTLLMHVLNSHAPTYPLTLIYSPHMNNQETIH